MDANSVNRVKIKPHLHLELRRVSSSVAAFSVAIILLWTQGSFPTNDYSWVPVAMFTIAAPVCTSTSLLSFLFSHRDDVSNLSDKWLDWMMAVGIGLGLSGLFVLIAFKSFWMGVIFIFSVLVSSFAFVLIARSMDPKQTKNNDLKEGECREE